MNKLKNQVRNEIFRQVPNFDLDLALGPTGTSIGHERAKIEASE